MIISIDAEKLLYKNSKLFYTKTTQQTRSRGKLLKSDKGHLF